MHLIPELNGSICRHSGTYYWKTILLAFINSQRYNLNWQSPALLPIMIELPKINYKPGAWWVTEPHKSSLVWSRNFIVLHKSPARVQKHYPARPCPAAVSVSRQLPEVVTLVMAMFMLIKIGTQTERLKLRAPQSFLYCNNRQVQMHNRIPNLSYMNLSPKS